jgi:Domain of unknown function (DUF1843)
MVAKKASTKLTKTIVQTKPVFKLPPGKGPHPLYGRPINEAIKFGTLAQMRSMAKMARAHIKDVTSALSKLDAEIKKGGTKTTNAKSTSRR